MKRPPCRPTAAVGGAGPPGAAVGPGQDGHHVHALPGALQRPDAPPPPLPSLRLRESSRRHLSACPSSASAFPALGPSGLPASSAGLNPCNPEARGATSGPGS